MAGVVALGANSVDANYADYDDTHHVAAGFDKPSIQQEIVGIDKERLREVDPLLLEDPTLQKDIVNVENIQNEKQNFGNKIGKGLNLADCSPLAYKNNTQHTQDIFDTSFLNDLYVYGDYNPVLVVDSSSDMTSDAISLTSKMESSIAVSAGVEATYACITAEVSTKVGFSIGFSTTLSESIAVYNYNYYRQTYGYYLPLFDLHKNLYKNHLTTHFRNELNEVLQINEQWRYEDFFERYGSHVLMSGFYGGASTIYGSIISNEMKNSVETKESVANTVKAGLDGGAYKIKATGGVETSFSQGFGVETGHSQETYHAEYYGGEATPASHSLHEVFTTADTWAATVDAHPVCVKYGDTIPVWYLLTGEQNTESNVYAFERAFEIYRVSRQEHYMSLAYQKQYTDTLRYTRKATPTGEVTKVTKSSPLTKQFNLLGSEFYYLPALEEVGFNQVQLVVKLTTTNNTPKDSKLTVRVVLGNHDYGYGYDYSLNANQETEVVYDCLYREYLSDLLYNNSAVTVQIKASNNKNIFVKDVNFEIIYTAPTQFGAGTATSPYLIYNVYQLRNIQNNMEVYYKLAQDIYFDPNKSWDPIPGRFAGSLNGDHHTLINFNITRTGYMGNGYKSLGLFEQLGDGSYISNLKIVGASLVVEPNGSDPLIYAGLITGMQNGGVIYNCTFENTTVRVTTSFGLAGTITGYAKGTILSCIVRGTNVFGKDVIGGITGTIDTNGTIDNCTVTKYNNTKSRIELQAGSNDAASYRAGGIAGYGFSSVTKYSRVEYTNFYLTGSIVRNPAMGYIVGHLNRAKILSSTQGSNSKNSSKSKNFFACDSGKVGKKEGTCTVN